MKNYFCEKLSLLSKTIKHLILISLILISACQKNGDSVIEDQNTLDSTIIESLDGNFNFERSTKADINKDQRLQSILANNSFYSPYNQQSKTNEKFEIDVSNYTKFVVGDYESYTFNVIPSEPINGFQNLVYISQKDGSFAEYLYSYHLSLEETKLLQAASPVELEGKLNKEFLGFVNPEKTLKNGTISNKGSSSSVCYISYWKDKNMDGGYYWPNQSSCENDIGSGNCVRQSIAVDCPEVLDAGNTSSGGGGSGGSGGGEEGFIWIIYDGPSNVNTGLLDPVSTSVNGIGGSGMTSPIVNTVGYELRTSLGFYNTEPEAAWLENPENEEIAANILVKYMASGETRDAKMASRITIKAIMQDKLGGPFDTQFLNSINKDTQVDLTQSDPGLQWAIQFSIRCAELKRQHPNWQDWEIFWEASKDMVHLGLDLIGFIPLFGEPADIVNGLLYAIEGDGTNATLSLASAVPLVGWWTGGTKMGLKIVNAASALGPVANSSRQILKWIRTSSGKIDFGDRNQLRKVLDLAPTTVDPRQAHHIIPWSSRFDNVVQQAAKSGDAFHLNEALNGIPVAAWRNQPNHNAYNLLVNERLSQIWATNPTPEEAYLAIQGLINNIRNAIANNPSKHLNDLNF